MESGLVEGGAGSSPAAAFAHPAPPRASRPAHVAAGALLAGVGAVCAAFALLRLSTLPPGTLGDLAQGLTYVSLGVLVAGVASTGAGVQLARGRRTVRWVALGFGGCATIAALFALFWVFPGMCACTIN
jgi:hypothetical protein